MVTCEESGSFTEEHIDLLQSHQLSWLASGGGEPLLGAPMGQEQRLLQGSQRGAARNTGTLSITKYNVSPMYLEKY